MQLRDGNHAAHGTPGTPIRRRIPVRWWIVGMLFVGSVVNYLDRITLSIVAPMIRDEFGLSASDYALVVNVFLVAYTFSYGFGGKLADFLGTRVSYYVTVTWWSIAACLHTLTQGLYSLCAYRFLLGLGEAGFFPTGVKAISEWFHPRDRGKPISIMLLGLGIGALLGPPVVSWLTLNVGWRAMFLITGLLGFLLLLPWTFIYRKPEEHPRLTEEEQEYLQESANAIQDDTGQKMRVRDFLRFRGVWTLLGARSLADGTWYFYLFWMPEYLMRERGFSMEMIGGLLWIPFLASDLGLLLGGWISTFLIRRNLGIPKTRKVCMLGGTLVVPLGILINSVSNPYLIIFLMCVVFCAFAIWSVNVQTVATDMTEAHSVGTLFGMAGCAGTIGAVVVQSLIGRFIDLQLYSLVFWLIGTLPLTAALLMLTVPIRKLRHPDGGDFQETVTE